MSTETIQQISYLSLIHDIYYIVNSIDLNYDKNIFFNTTCFDDVKKFDFLLKIFTKKNLDNLPLNEARIIGELISEAEQISLACDITEKGELSPLKSIFSLSAGHDYFFNASEISENILLGTKKSKKDLYFAPSYLVSSFIDEFEALSKSTAFQINTLYFLIKKYFWSISLAHHGEDFSFSVYTHAKMTCAIACALYQYLNEHHNNIFISQNINMIRETLQNPTEPRFLFLKLSCEQKTNVKKISIRHLLLWASHIIINRFHLYTPSIFHVTEEYSILILPNTNNKQLTDIITEIKDYIFTELSPDIHFSTSSFTLRKNDISPHFSSSHKISSLIFDNIITTVPTTDTLFFEKNYDYYFTPQTPYDNKKDMAIKLPEKINFLNIPTSTEKISMLNYDEIKQDKNSTGNFRYLFNTDFSLAKYNNCGFLLDTICNNETESLPKITINIAVSNPESNLPYYPSISLIGTLFDLTELITQLGIKNILKKSDSRISKSSGNTISFSADPLSLRKILNEIYHYYISIIGNCDTVSISAYIQTEPFEKNNYVKLDIQEKQNLVFIFDNFLEWDQIFELFEQAEFLTNFYETCDNEEKKAFIAFLKNTIKTKYFNVSHLSDYIGDQDAYEYFVNVNNPFLLTKLLDMIIEKE